MAHHGSHTRAGSQDIHAEGSPCRAHHLTSAQTSAFCHVLFSRPPPLPFSKAKAA